MGTFNCCRAIVPNMIKNNYGRIVNVASVSWQKMVMQMQAHIAQEKQEQLV